VLAIAAGVVTFSGARANYGNLVEIDHGNGLVTRYGHNKENLVTVGDAVKKGESSRWSARPAAPPRRTCTRGARERPRGQSAPVRPHNANGQTRQPGAGAGFPARRQTVKYGSLSAGGRRRQPQIFSTGARRMQRAPRCPPVRNLFAGIFGSRNQRLLKSYGKNVKQSMRSRSSVAALDGAAMKAARPS
jgi:hypothetical protein